MDDFLPKGYHKTEYNALNKGALERVTETGRKSIIMTAKVLRIPNRKFNNSDGLSQRKATKR